MCVLYVFMLFQAGLEFTAEYEKRIDAYLAKSKAEREALKAKKSGGKEVLHEYKLEDYGLSEAKVREAFHEYIELYNLAAPKKK